MQIENSRKFDVLLVPASTYKQRYIYPCARMNSQLDKPSRNSDQDVNIRPVCITKARCVNKDNRKPIGTCNWDGLNVSGGGMQPMANGTAVLTGSSVDELRLRVTTYAKRSQGRTYGTFPNSGGAHDTRRLNIYGAEGGLELLTV
jgi:hypothetical protein